MHDLVLAGALMLVAGVAINPTLTTTALLVDRHAPARAAEAFGWLSTAMAAGTGAGSALGGAVAGSSGGAAGAFGVAAIASGLAAVVAGASRPLLESP
jgi:predicted MFS family arabinose efflux permease